MLPKYNEEKGITSDLDWKECRQEIEVRAARELGSCYRLLAKGGKDVIEGENRGKEHR
jgi:hypothetical protein